MDTQHTSSTHRLIPTRWKMVLLLFGLYMINFIDRMSLSIGLPVISKEFHIDPMWEGVILSAFFWTYCGFQIPGGALVDRLGGRKVLTWAAVLWGGFQCLSAASVNGLMLFLTRLGLGAFEAPAMPAASKLTANWLAPAERARGITFIDSAGSLGSAVGGLIITGMILFFGSWRIAFLVIGILTVVGGLIIYRYIRDTPEESTTINADELTFIQESKAQAGEAHSAPDNRHMSGRTFASMVIGRIGWTMIFFGLVTWGPNYLSSRGMDIKGMGYGTFIMFMGAMIGNILGGQIVDKLQHVFSRNVSYKLILGVSGLAVTICLVVLPSVTSDLSAVTLLTVGLFFLQLGGIYWSIPGMLAPRTRIGLVGGIMNFAGTSSGIVVPLIIGGIVKMTGSYDMALFYLAFCGAVYFTGSQIIDFRRPEEIVAAAPIEKTV